jgi:hypothetical protein
LAAATPIQEWYNNARRFNEISQELKKHGRDVPRPLAIEKTSLARVIHQALYRPRPDDALPRPTAG